MLQNSQKFRVLWHGRTELTDVPGRYKNAVPVPRVFMARAYRDDRSFGHRYESRTELTEVPGTGMNVLHNLQTFFVGNTQGKYPVYGSAHTLQNTTLKNSSCNLKVSKFIPGTIFFNSLISILTCNEIYDAGRN